MLDKYRQNVAEFDLEVGDIIYATDTILGDMARFRVKFISKQVFEAERVDMPAQVRGFRKMDYQLGFITKK